MTSSASGDASSHGVLIMLGGVVEANVALVAVDGESVVARRERAAEEARFDIGASRLE